VVQYVDMQSMTRGGDGAPELGQDGGPPDCRCCWRRGRRGWLCSSLTIANLCLITHVDSNDPIVTESM